MRSNMATSPSLRLLFALVGAACPGDQLPFPSQCGPRNSGSYFSRRSPTSLPIGTRNLVPFTSFTPT